MSAKTSATTPSQNKRIISAYTAKLRTPINFTGPGRTKQSFKDECDINNIMARYRTTRLLTWTNENQPRYADCTGYDYQVAMQTITQANGLFQGMPSALRAEFDNDPQKFLAFCEDERNLPRLEEMGLLRPDYKASGLPTDTVPPNQSVPPTSNPPANKPAEGGTAKA